MDEPQLLIQTAWKRRIRELELRADFAIMSFEKVTADKNIDIHNMVAICLVAAAILSDGGRKIQYTLQNCPDGALRAVAETVKIGRDLIAAKLNEEFPCES